MQALVEQEMATIPWPDVREFIQGTLMQPVSTVRKWDYGIAEFPCWVVAVVNGFEIVYCPYGHPRDWAIPGSGWTVPGT